MWPAALPQEACRRVSAMLVRERERQRDWDDREDFLDFAVA